MENLFIVSSSPHYRAKTTVRGVMLDVVIALVPALVAAVVFFGLRALTLVLVKRFSIKSEKEKIPYLTFHAL